MSTITVNTHQRGQCVVILLSIMRNHADYGQFATNPIDVNEMAVVEIKCKGVSSPQYYLSQTIKFKKHNNSKNSTVIINIISDEFEKQFFCHDEWVEVPMKEKEYNHCVYTNQNTFMYVIKIQITVHVQMPATYSLCKEIYEETEFTDFKLQAEDGCVPVHKSVLFVHSEMFRGMLRGNWKENEEDTMKMPGVTMQTLQHLKQYMYLGTIPDEELEPLLLVANRCLMDSLAARCIEKLVSTVRVETFDGLVELACQNNIPALMRALLLRIPDEVVNGIAKMDINKKNFNDTTK